MRNIDWSRYKLYTVKCNCGHKYESKVKMEIAIGTPTYNHITELPCPKCGQLEFHVDWARKIKEC